MAYFHLNINGLSEDEFEGKPRIRVDWSELNPRSGKLNLSKADAATITKFKSLIGKTAMVPAREGIMNGQPFLSLLPGEIIPLPGAAPISTANPVKELDPAPIKPLFNK
ncbi:MAG: hypothetical protein ACOYM1_10745 [Methylovulum sp.]